MISRINTSSGDGNDSIAFIAPSVMMTSIENLDPEIKALIKLVESNHYTIDGNCVMAVTLHQQGITTFKHLREFPFRAEFERRFSSYKRHDADVGTTNGTDVILSITKTYLRFLFLWTIHQNDEKSNNPLAWTYDEYRAFCHDCRYSRTTTLYGWYDCMISGRALSNDAHSNDLKPEIIYLLKITNLGGFGTSKDPIAFACNQAGYHDFDTFRMALQDFSPDDFSYNEKEDKSGKEISILTSHRKRFHLLLQWCNHRTDADSCKPLRYTKDQWKRFTSAFCHLKSDEVHFLTITGLGDTPTDEMALALDQEHTMTNIDDLECYNQVYYFIPTTYNDKIDGTGNNHRISFGTWKQFRVLVDWIHYRYDSNDPDHHNPFYGQQINGIDFVWTTMMNILLINGIGQNPFVTKTGGMRISSQNCHLVIVLHSMIFRTLIQTS